MKKLLAMLPWDFIVTVTVIATTVTTSIWVIQRNDTIEPVADKEEEVIVNVPSSCIRKTRT